MFKRVIEQSKYVENSFLHMSSRATIAFALSCTERQWPVFQRAVTGKSGLTTVKRVFRDAIDLCWKHCSHGVLITVECERELPDEALNAPSAVAHTILHSIFDVLTATSENYGNYRMSCRNFGLIELLLDDCGLLLDDLEEDPSKDPPLAKRVRPLVVKELDRQNEDLRRLSNDDSLAMIETVKRESYGVSLFDEVWF